MKIVIINYGAGNLHSVRKSFESANLNLGGTNDIVISSDASELKPCGLYRSYSSLGSFIQSIARLQPYMA